MESGYFVSLETMCHYESSVETVLTDECDAANDLQLRQATITKEKLTWKKIDFQSMKN